MCLCRIINSPTGGKRGLRASDFYPVLQIVTRKLGVRLHFLTELAQTSPGKLQKTLKAPPSQATPHPLPNALRISGSLFCHDQPHPGHDAALIQPPGYAPDRRAIAPDRGLPAAPFAPDPVAGVRIRGIELLAVPPHECHRHSVKPQPCLDGQAGYRVTRFFLGVSP